MPSFIIRCSQLTSYCVQGTRGSPHCRSDLFEPCAHRLFELLFVPVRSFLSPFSAVLLSFYHCFRVRKVRLVRLLDPVEQELDKSPDSPGNSDGPADDGAVLLCESVGCLR